VEVEGDVSKSNPGYHFSHVLIRPKLTIPREAGETQAIALLEKTRDLCLVSRALSVEQKFDPYVQVGQLLAQGGPSIAGF
jgi:organic hydroperoxide reductase OsmC/OhrA